MSTDPDTTTGVQEAGRQIVLTPVPRGVWLIIGGSVVAGLGPLFGFLIGTMMGSTTETGGLSPIYLMLLLGIVLGGLGVGAVLLGVRRVLSDRSAAEPAPPDA